MSSKFTQHWSWLFLAAVSISTSVPAAAQQPPWRQARGIEIEAVLGNRLPEVAQRYGLTDTEFHNLVQRDKSIGTDLEANLLYACPPPSVPVRVIGPSNATTTSASTGTVAAGPYPADQTLLLHSRAASTKKIFLDFTGHTTTGTSWNTSYTAGASFTTPPFDIDGVVSTTFSAAELDRIQFIWKRVCEDFAAFDVDVTTEDPGVEALRKTTSTDTAYGVRVCIGGSSNDWFKASAGGVAYVGSYNWNTDTPCFIFTAQLGNGAEKYTAEATSHEVGHTLGLNHDGQVATSTTAAVEYYQGHADWAPIMGVGYYKGVTQWSKGEYLLANNKQDDLAVMQTYGAALRADEHGNTTVTATALTGTSVTATGVISTRTDADLFGFTTGDGNVSFNVANAAPDADVDVQLALYNGAGLLITSTNPTGLAGSLSATLAAGTYYLAVDGVGTGDATTGYSDYASIGQFYLSGSVITPGNQPPTVVVTGTPTSGSTPLTVAFSSAGTFDVDGTIASYNWDFGDGSAQSAEVSPTHVYTTVGSYVASLVAFDNGGLSASATTTITVKAPTVAMSVSNIAMSASTSKSGSVATAVVTVLSSTGTPVASAVVSGTWKGLVTGTVSVTTNSAGQATFTTPRVRGSGTFTFTVNSATATGYTYDATKNVETTDSVAVP